VLSNKAKQLIRQRNMYAKNREQLYNQQFNAEQIQFAKDNIDNTKQMVSAMKSAKEDFKQGMKDLNIDEIEDLHDDMDELLEDNEELNEIMGRAYGVPEELDEDELMNELDDLEDEFEEEEEQETEETPDYLVSAASAANDNVESESKVQPAVESKHNKVEAKEMA